MNRKYVVVNSLKYEIKNTNKDIKKYYFKKLKKSFGIDSISSLTVSLGMGAACLINIDSPNSIVMAATAVATNLFILANATAFVKSTGIKDSEVKSSKDIEELKA